MNLKNMLSGRNQPQKITYMYEMSEMDKSVEIENRLMIVGRNGGGC
jgi:hypothetical protein